jgi:GNAT superfamily N-acetyltransferase
MIRNATLADLQAILSMVERLHEAAGVLIPMHRPFTEGFVQALMGHPDGLAIVLDRDGVAVGMLIAAIGTSSVSPAPVAIEHGWYVEPEARGHGGALLAHYEQWARDKGCFAIRMSTPPNTEGPAAILEHKGFTRSEIAWAKVL